MRGVLAEVPAQSRRAGGSRLGDRYCDGNSKRLFEATLGVFTPDSIVVVVMKGGRGHIMKKDTWKKFRLEQGVLVWWHIFYGTYFRICSNTSLRDDCLTCDVLYSIYLSIYSRSKRYPPEI